MIRDKIKTEEKELAFQWDVIKITSSIFISSRNRPCLQRFFDINFELDIELIAYIKRIR